MEVPHLLNVPGPKLAVEEPLGRGVARVDGVRAEDQVVRGDTVLPVAEMGRLGAGGDLSDRFLVGQPMGVPRAASDASLPVPVLVLGARPSPAQRGRGPLDRLRLLPEVLEPARAGTRRAELREACPVTTNEPHRLAGDMTLAAVGLLRDVRPLAASAVAIAERHFDVGPGDHQATSAWSSSNAAILARTRCVAAARASAYSLCACSPDSGQSSG